jgi:hypothetical protein
MTDYGDVFAFAFAIFLAGRKLRYKTFVKLNEPLQSMPSFRYFPVNASDSKDFF